MKLLVCGGRDFDDIEYAVPRLQRFHAQYGVTELICGMAKGGDMLGHRWAQAVDVPIVEFPPDWDRYGRKAGPIRNQQMLDEGKPDWVIAFPGGTGTAHMATIAKAAGVNRTVYERLYFRSADPKHAFLSNFWPELQVNEGKRYRSNEHYYQSRKTDDPVISQWIAESTDARTAKKRGNHESVPKRADWDWYKITVMRDGLRAKFSTGSDMAARLVATGDLYLIEYAPWGDRFWGVDKNHIGENWLGRLLMERRDELVYGEELV